MKLTPIEHTHIETACNTIKWRVEDLFFEGKTLEQARKLAIIEFAWVGLSKDFKAQIIDLVYSFNTNTFDKFRMSKKLNSEYNAHCKTIGQKPTKIGGWLFRKFGLL